MSGLVSVKDIIIPITSRSFRAAVERVVLIFVLLRYFGLLKSLLRFTETRGGFERSIDEHKGFVWLHRYHITLLPRQSFTGDFLQPYSKCAVVGTL